MTSLARLLRRERGSSRRVAKPAALAPASAVFPAPPTAAHTAPTTDDPILPAPRNSAMEAAADTQPSTNVGNTLDAIPDETSWGNPPTTKALFDAFRSQGYHSIRIPATRDSPSSATAPHTADPAFPARVKQVADRALSDGLYVVINLHHDSWEWIANTTTDHDTVPARHDALWTQICAEFKQEPRKLLCRAGRGCRPRGPRQRPAPGASVPPVLCVVLAVIGPRHRRGPPGARWPGRRGSCQHRE